jgi:hypothetical protein
MQIEPDNNPVEEDQEANEIPVHKPRNNKSKDQRWDKNEKDSLNQTQGTHKSHNSMLSQTQDSLISLKEQFSIATRDNPDIQKAYKRLWTWHG